MVIAEQSWDHVGSGLAMLRFPAHRIIALLVTTVAARATQAAAVEAVPGLAAETPAVAIRRPTVLTQLAVPMMATVRVRRSRSGIRIAICHRVRPTRA
jgi:hypothetical protein